MLDYAPYMDRQRAERCGTWPAGWTWIDQLVDRQPGDRAVPHLDARPGLTRRVRSRTPGGCLYQRLTFPSVSAGPIHAFPKLVQLRGQVSDQGRFLEADRPPRAEDRRRLSPSAGVWRHLRRWQPRRINFFHDPVGHRHQLERAVSAGIPDAWDRPADHGVQRSDRRLRLRRQLELRRLHAGRLSRCRRNVTLNLGLRYDIDQYMNQPNLERNRTYQVARGDRQPVRASSRRRTRTTSRRVSASPGTSRATGRAWCAAATACTTCMQIKNTYYQRNYIEKDIVFINADLSRIRRLASGPLANFIYGVTPIESVAPTPVNPTNFPTGGNNTGYWYDPNIKDAQTHKWHAGYSRVARAGHGDLRRLPHTSCCQNGWRNLNINPLVDHDNNPATAGVRPLRRGVSTRLQRSRPDGRRQYRGLGQSRHLR